MNTSRRGTSLSGSGSAPIQPRRPRVSIANSTANVSSAGNHSSRSQQRPQLSGLLTMDERSAAEDLIGNANRNSQPERSVDSVDQFVNPQMPAVGNSRIPTHPRNAREAQRMQHEFEMKHDALLIVEQKAPNVWRLPDRNSNVNRILNSEDRTEAIRTLPLAFPPIRFRRGETVDEYVESVTKPWEEVRNNSSSSLVSRRMSVAGRRTHVEEMAMDAAEQKNEQLRRRHEHKVSKMWRQTHATKADLIIADQSSSSLLRPLLESATMKAIDIEEKMVSAVAASCRAGISATSRGLVVPYQYYEALVGGINTAVEDTFVAFFQSAQDDQSTAEASRDEVANTSLKQLTDGKGGWGGSHKHHHHAERHVDVKLPEPGHPSRHSFIAVKTATHVTVLWRMLEQVQGIVPGMDTALHLLHELLPLLYVDFVQVNVLQPNVSSLAEQIRQLCSIPLVALQLQRTEANEQQFRQDAEYLRQAMENWSFNIWRNYNTMERRRANHLATLHNWFQRYESKRIVASAFQEWRVLVMKEKVSVVVNEMRGRYDDFIKASRHAAAETIPMSTNRAVAANQARFFAQRLAATATHEKHSATGSTSGNFPRNVSSTVVSPTGRSAPPAVGDVIMRSTSPIAVGATSPVHSISPNAVSPVSQKVPSLPSLTGGLHQSSSGREGLGNSGEGTAPGAPVKRQFFDEVLAKLQTLEDVSGHLREYIAIQRKTIDKMEVEARNLTERLNESRTEAKKLIEENLRLNNLIQQKDLKIREQLRQVLRLKSKVRLHRHRHWRASAMRVLSETLGVSNVHVEAKDAIGTSGGVVSPSASMSRASVDPLQAALDDDGGDESESEQADPEFASKAQSQSEKERIFGRLAPLVLDAPSQLPDALTILKDWGNNCLDDLQSLDGVGGASLSSRFSSLTTELRDGIIISRLLFYLALPRYRPPSGRNDELEDVNPDFNVNRMRLLKQRGVQLHSPFPTYDDCFGDLMRYPPVKRMSILLNFASDLISATHRLTPDQLEALETLQMLADRSKSESVDETPVSNSPRLSLAGDGLLGAKRSSSPQLKRKTSSKVLLKWMEGVPKSQRRGSTAFGSDDATFPSSSEFLPQYVDPILLCEGSKAASVTLLAMLYVRFAHAFNHKAQETAAKEVELMRALLRDQESSSGGGGGGGISSPTRGRGSVAQPSKLDTMLSAIDEEEKSPWNIFLDRCKPFFTSSAHGFVLEGNFWSAMTCESAEMLEVFSAVTCAMQRSLETHRWHITMQCLTPLISSIGMTRGCFSGMLASTDYYLYQRSCEAQDIVFMPEVVYLLATQRKEILPPNEQGGVGSSSASTRQLSELPTSPPCENIIVAPMVPNHDTFIELEDSTNTSGCDPDEFRKHPYYQRLQDVLHAFTDDLARVFLSRASTNSTMLAPIVTLASWRMLWMDAGLCPGKISLEAITFMFSDACQSQHQTRQHLGGGGNAHRGSGDDSTTSSDHGGGITIASLQEMSFDAFYDGCLRVANYRYAPVTLGASGGGGGNGASIGPSHISSPGMSALESSHYNHHPPPLSGFHSVSPSASRATSASTGKKKVYTSLQEAFTKLLVDVIVPLHPIHSPPVAIQHLKQGVLVQDLLRRRNAELLAVFQAYAKVHLGITAVEKDDALRMIKDAGLATAELSYQVVADLFVECSVKRTLADQSAMNAMDPWHVDALYGGGGHSGSIFQNTANSNNNSAAPPAGGMAALQALAAQQQRSSASRNHQSLMQQTTVDRQLLDFTAFVDFICVLMLYKLPNPFQPMHTKLEYFLDRNVIAPLRFRVDQAAKARARRRDTNVGAPNAGTGKFLNLLESVQQQSL